MKKHDQPYIIQLSAHVYLNVYMLALAGQTAGPNRQTAGPNRQTAGPNRQTNFEGTQGTQGRPVSKNSFFLNDFFLFHGQRLGLHLS